MENYEDPWIRWYWRIVGGACLVAAVAAMWQVVGIGRLLARCPQ